MYCGVYVLYRVDGGTFDKALDEGFEAERVEFVFRVGFVHRNDRCDDDYTEFDCKGNLG